VPARPQAAPDLGDEGLGIREVLQDEDREDTSQRRIREAERLPDVAYAETRVDLIARRSCPRGLDHARCPVDTDDVITAPRECERVRARSAAEVGYRSGRCDHARELIGGPLDQLALLWIIASPLPGRALAVVHEAKEPVRGRHSDDTMPAAAVLVPDTIRELVVASA
jgi:hypothetical protein